MKILVTGAAGFIGYHLVKSLLKRGDNVVGLDSINSYYDTQLKYDRLASVGIESERVEYNLLVQSSQTDSYRFIKLDLCDRDELAALFATESFDVVVNLAAQAGVRYSIENPHAYIDSNITGFVNLMECVRHSSTRYVVYASSSSVYGDNGKVPFSESDSVDNPVSLYAATKKANELMANVYSTMYGINMVGLRFFTVYGPWGRPDMAPMLFAKAILAGEPIKVFNNGDLARDFTYIDDIVEGVVRVVDGYRQQRDKVLTEVYNIGCGSPVQLMDFVKCMETTLGCDADKIMMPMQAGDVPITYADTSKLERDYGYRPQVMLADGVALFVQWYKKYFK